MQISIWQQWASNHSVWFSVVGTFPNSETAASAAAEVRSVLRQVQDYWQYVKPEDQGDWDDETLSPPEEAIKRHYNIEWIPIPWFTHSRVHEIKDSVSVVDRFVLFSNPVGDTRTGPRPVTYLLKHLGAELAAFCEGSGTDPDSLLFGHVTFIAPNESAAAEIDLTLRQYFETASKELIAAKDTRQVSEYSAGESPYRWYEVIRSGPGEVAVQRVGSGISIRHLLLIDVVQIEIFVKDVISWLKHQQCGNIEVSFSSEPDSHAR
jgi:hypothetical protein